MNFLDVVKPLNVTVYTDKKSRDKFIDPAGLADLLDKQPSFKTRLMYNYALLGSLSNWKINDKSVTAEDSTGKRVRFIWTSRYKFWIVCFDIIEN